ncbi:MAG: TIGR00282 family metallophosphoesterase [Patescibacteria group bacterium]
MNILFIGDIVGRVGRKAVTELLPNLKKEHKIDMTIANVENLAHGRGVTEATLDEMANLSIDCFTSGNHIWRNKAVFEILESKKHPLVRPANYPDGTPGCGYLSFNISQKNIYVLNLQGRVFMQDLVDDPFATFDKLYADIDPGKEDIVIVDFHAEATSEKQAFGYYVDGKVTAVVGTHTHIPTADERLLEKGTAYITDSGCVAGTNSVLGVEQKSIITALTTGLPQKHEYPESGEVTFNSVLLTIDDTGNASSIKRITNQVLINN